MKNHIIDFDKPFLCSVEGFEPLPITELMDIIDEKNKIIRTRLAHLDQISRNRALYGLVDVTSALRNSKYIQECIAQGVWFGELEHPPRGCEIPRFMRVDDDRISHKIHKYWTESDGFLKGIVQFVEPKGGTVWDWIQKAGANMAFSLRIYTPNYIKKKDKNGVPYVEKVNPMFPVTFDVVKTPGYEQVRVADPTQFQMKNKYYITNEKNSMGVENYSIDWFDINASENIKKVLNSTSEEELNIVGDLFDMDMKAARAYFNKDTMKVTLGTEEKELTFNVNTFLFNEIMSSGSI